jgi:imidazoleglycerol phosphate dehydratase HisB
MQQRTGKASIHDKEVNIEVLISLDEPGEYPIIISSRKEEPHIDIATVNLFEHLYQQIYCHGYMSGHIKAEGDLPHHVLEDLAIAYGQALKEAVGDRSGIRRFGNSFVPHEGSLAFVTIDYSSRGHYEVNFSDIEDYGLRTMSEHTFYSMSREAGFDIWGYTKTTGSLRDDHHKLEAFFKAFGTTLHDVTRIYEPGKETIPSTKSA